MKLQNRILLYFSSTVITLTAISLTVIYLLFAEHREQEFRQRQREKIKLTIELLAKYKEMSENLTEMMDRLTIHDFYDEKVLIFDRHKDLIYESVDDLPIANRNAILTQLSPAMRELELKENGYEIIGVYEERANTHFYAISKAYDKFGYTKLTFLRNTLIFIFISISALVVFISLFLSKRISEPIIRLAQKLGRFKVGDNPDYTALHTNTYELNYLNEKFHQLLKRTNESFDFQKHTIHHISHELKTPIAILVSELERIGQNQLPGDLNRQLEEQITNGKSLGDIINTLLEISKLEAGQEVFTQAVRVDELIFDLVEGFNLIHPTFTFELNFFPENIDETRLEIRANRMLLRQAFQNILANCISYADNGSAKISIDCSSPSQLKVQFSNSGKAVSQEEQKYLFNHFFRGENSRGKGGFGLGLVLVKRIINLHHGTIEYAHADNQFNVFELTFPLR
ncbi:sensor histidine kinase [Pontibacter chinhatensis]|uniref:histidine kinase n=1 Tax=Pontibacter chinhatensis TaxID=1436961 RepID=A0A1I2WPV9_9BACT|nr:HAMP domain-containing sensor histidine kinase [Pontibacter chinhatensis]SFH03373.1 Signal transduction histidine kinase [Pontibacter chinhatensis]